MKLLQYIIQVKGISNRGHFSLCVISVQVLLFCYFFMKLQICFYIVRLLLTTPLTCFKLVFIYVIFGGLSTRLIKSIKIILKRPITIRINQMLNTGIFPDKFQIAKINPIYKKEDGNVFTNYRPILLLPAISKVFEKVIFQQVYAFYCAQYGFRAGHST